MYHALPRTEQCRAVHARGGTGKQTCPPCSVVGLPASLCGRARWTLIKIKIRASGGMVNAHGLGPCEETLGGSNPLSPTL